MRQFISLAASIATLILAAPAFSQQQPPAVPAELQARLDKAHARLQSIQDRATRVADMHELLNLQQIYGYYVDKALWDDVASLFTSNGTLELGFNGVYEGQKSIRRYLYSLTGGKPGLQQGQLNNHFQLSPLITISPDGNSAKGRWRALIQDGVYGKGSGGNWGEGIYENEYVREGGVWKISKLQFFVKFYAPYEAGWTRAHPDSARRYGKSTVRPDRPSSVKYQAFPSHYTPVFHYENPVTTGYKFAAPAAAKKRAPAPSSVAELEAQVRAARLQLERLRSTDDVRNLEAIYGYYADKSMQDAISALFTEDATLEILGRGVFIGTGRIYEYMRRLGAPTQGSLFNHMQLQPVVTVSPDGNSAKMRARLLVMFGATGRAAQWGEGIYENSFVKENGVWKYQNLHGYQTFYTNYESGWAKQAAAMFSPFPGYPPDLPQSVAYEVYPALFIPPFHYKNPVTGE